MFAPARKLNREAPLRFGKQSKRQSIDLKIDSATKTGIFAYEIVDPNSTRYYSINKRMSSFYTVRNKYVKGAEG